METIAQNIKHQAATANEEVKDKKRKRSGFDTMLWLAEKTTRDAEFKEKDQRSKRKKRKKERKGLT